MKGTRLLTISMLILCTTFCCCNKDDDNGNPEDSDNFSEYFTCKVNGVDFYPLSDFTCNGKLFGYYPESGVGIDAGYMVISGFDCASNKTVKLRFFGISPETGNLNFLEPSFADSCSPFYKHYLDAGVEIEMDKLISGEMQLTSFTPRQANNGPFGKIEGTFEFTVTNENNDSTIYITDGAFRFKVPNTW